MRLTYREHRLIAAVVIISLVWLSYVFGLKPAIERVETLNRVIPENERKLQDIRIKSERYLALAAALEDVRNNNAQNQPDFEPVAFLESHCINYGIAKKVITLKQEVLPVDSQYSEIVAEIQLENITLKQLVEFLLKIGSTNQPLSIKSLYIKKAYADSNLIGVVLQVSSFKLNT